MSDPTQETAEDIRRLIDAKIAARGGVGAPPLDDEAEDDDDARPEGCLELCDWPETDCECQSIIHGEGTSLDCPDCGNHRDVCVCDDEDDEDEE